MDVNVQFLVDNRQHSNLLTIVATAKNAELFKLLSECKFNLKKFFTRQYRDHTSPYLLLCKNGSVDILRMIDDVLQKQFKSSLSLLCTKGLWSDINGNNPFHLASICQNATETIEYLVNNVYKKAPEILTKCQEQLNKKYVFCKLDLHC